MSEYIEVLKFLHGAGESIIPWVVITFFVIVSYKLYPYVIDWFKSRSLAHREQAKAQMELNKREAERNEILRHNNAVIENCTTTMKITEQFIKDTETRYLNALKSHEDLSEERMTRLQAVINRNAETLGKIQGNIGIIMDRTDK